jgi:Tfp pilus assembly protein PilF
MGFGSLGILLTLTGEDMTMHRAAVAAMILLVTATTALPADQQDWNECMFPGDVIGPGIEACTRIIQDRDESVRLLVVAYISRGLQYEASDKYDRAIADFTKAIELNPQDPMAYDHRGDAYYRVHDYTRAIADFTKVIEINPGYANVYFNLGISYKASGAVDLAIRYLSFAIDVNHRDADAYRMRAKIYQARGDLNRAVSDLDKAAEIWGCGEFPRTVGYDPHNCLVANVHWCMEPGHPAPQP